MAITFESLDSDIAGRTGKLGAGKRVIRTPALLPVINPHLMLVTPKELRTMGVGALITNAYIFSQSRQYSERVKEEGLHKLLDFDGVIMTDSGSFQLSVYGEVSITNEQTLTYQRDIGSDIWVPLDIPTSPDADRETAERELAITMERLCEARELFGTEAPIAGPVQGGIYQDLRERAGKEVGELGFTFCPIGAVVPLMEAYRYRDLVNVVMAAKRTLPRSSCIHLFGAGHPVMFALAAAMGCDLFDSAAYALYAKEGRYLTTHGSFKIDELTDLPCSCVVCRSHTAEELRTAKDRIRLLALHNLAVTLAEISGSARRLRMGHSGSLWTSGAGTTLSSLPATGNCSVTTHRSKCMTGSRSAGSSTGATRAAPEARSCGISVIWRGCASGRTCLSPAMPGSGTGMTMCFFSSRRSGLTLPDSKRHFPSARARSPTGMQPWSGRDAGYPDACSEP